MSLQINHNMMASNAARYLNQHYAQLGTSVRRLSSGLRVSQAADDAAGLAIRELMRADIATLRAGARNANDGISLLQTADGALQIIDEKLIRMKELAVQAATGTYNSDQRLIINSEFQAMASEIQRIAVSTEFNGVKLLDGSLSGVHNGNGLQSTGALKVHFGTGNDSAEDYYYLSIGRATLGGLGLSDGGTVDIGGARTLDQVLVNGAALYGFLSGVVSFAVVPRGSTNLKFTLYDRGVNDTIQVFTRSGTLIAGTTINGASNGWANAGVHSVADMNSRVLTVANGFYAGATYNEAVLNGTGNNLPYNRTAPYNQFSYNGMNIGYSGDGNPTDNVAMASRYEYLTIDNVTEELVIIVSGAGWFDAQGSWDAMPGLTSMTMLDTPPITIETQAKGQVALERLDQAITIKDNIRAHIGALQNRLENTVTNLLTQAENLQAAESRISDVDVATEMTQFVRNQVLVSASTAMLSQANSLPQMALQLLQ